MAKTYGWSDEYLMLMDADIFQDYWLAIDAMEAGASMNEVINTSFHTMKKSDRDKYFNNLSKKTKSIILEENDAILDLATAAKKLAKRLSLG